MKKNWKSFFALCLVCSLMGGCVSPKNAADQGEKQEAPVESSEKAELKETAAKEDPTTITMWFWGSTPEQQEVLKSSLIDKFNAENPGYRLEVEYRSSVNNDVRVAISADQGPDILYESSPGLAGTYIEAGKYADLTSYAEQYGWKDRLLEPAYNSCTFDGKLYLVPMGLDVLGMFYDSKTLEENGWDVPETIEEVEEIMDQAMEKGMYASLNGNATWRANNGDYVTMFLNNWAGPENVYQALMNEQGWDSEPLTEAVRKSAEWYQKGYLCKDYIALGRNEALQMMADKKAPFHFGTSKSFQFAVSFYEGERGGDLKFMALPAGREGIQPNYAMGCTGVLGINEASPHKDICAKFLDMLMTEETVGELSRDWPGYWYCPLKTLDQIDISDYPVYSQNAMNAICEAVKSIDRGNFGYFASSCMPPQTFDEFVNIEVVWFGDEEPESYMKKIDGIFEAEYEKGMVPPVPEPGK